MARKIDKYLVRYGDSFWKIGIRIFFWKLTRLFSFRLPMFPKNDSVCRVAFILKGGVGDILVAMNFVQNFSSWLHVEQAIDLGIPTRRALLSTVQELSRGQTFLRKIVSPHRLSHDYDLLIEIVRYPNILYSNKKKLSQRAPALAAWIESVEKFQRENPLLYRHGTPGDYLGARWTLLQGQNRLSQADVGGKIGVKSVFCPQHSIPVPEVLKKFGLENRPFLTLQRGVGGGNRNVSTKLWPEEHYKNFVALFKKRFPEIPVVQLGTEKNPPIPGCDLDLRGKTTFAEVMALVAEASVHLDGECGMVHLRHFLNGRPSVVLFGPTDERFYGYPENINLRSNACPGGCEWLSVFYTTCCSRGFAENECLTRLSPETVLDGVAKILEKA